MGGNAITLVSSSKQVEAGKIYNINRSAATAPAAKAAADATADDLGKVFGADGNIYDDADAATTAGTTAVAKIMYVGSDAETSTTYNHGLALALSDVSTSQTWCSQNSSTCLANQYDDEPGGKKDVAGLANTDALVSHTSHTHAAANAARNYNNGIHPKGTSEWFLPSAGQWFKMRYAAGGSFSTLKTNANLNSGNYWASSEINYYYAWLFNFTSSGYWDQYNKNGNAYLVRACLAF